MPNSVNARFFLAKIHLDLPSQFNKNIIIRSKNVSKGNEQVFFKTFIRTRFFLSFFRSSVFLEGRGFFFDFTLFFVLLLFFSFYVQFEEIK